MSIRTIVIAVSVCIAAPTGAAVPESFLRCAEKTSIPTEDLPSTPADLDKCDPLEFESRPGHPVALCAVRNCAYTARDGKGAEQDDMEIENIGGNASLAMIYAGGRGVAPNIPLAERFASESLSSALPPHSGFCRGLDLTNGPYLR